MGVAGLAEMAVRGAQSAAQKPRKSRSTASRGIIARQGERASRAMIDTRQRIDGRKGPAAGHGRPLLTPSAGPEARTRSASTNDTAATDRRGRARRKTIRSTGRSGSRSRQEGGTSPTGSRGVTGGDAQPAIRAAGCAHPR